MYKPHTIEQYKIQRLSLIHIYHASTIAEAGEGNAERATTLLKELMVQYIVKRKYAIEGLTTEELCEKLYEDMAGYSFLKKWIYKPGIEEVNINAYNDIEVIEAGGRSIKIPDKRCV